MMEDEIPFTDLQRYIWNLNHERCFLARRRQLLDWQKVVGTVEGQILRKKPKRASGAGHKATQFLLSTCVTKQRRYAKVTDGGYPRSGWKGSVGGIVLLYVKFNVAPK